MNSIEVYYASAPSSEIPIHTLEIKNEQASQNGDQDAVIRLADGFFYVSADGDEGLVLGLEDGTEAYFRSSAGRGSIRR